MNTNKTYYFIVNGNAGVGKKKNVWRNVLKPELIRRGVHYRVYECTHEGHGAQIVADIQADVCGPLTIIVVGGDGTFNEVLNGITDFSRVTMGFIPAGSANDLGYALGISSDPLQALVHILDREKHFSMDIGQTTFHRNASVRYFAISSGVGLDAEACAMAVGGRLKSLLNRLHLGRLVYLINAVRIVYTQPLTDGKFVFYDEDGNRTERIIRDIYFVAGMNQPNEGGHLIMAANAKSDDGKLSFAMAYGLKRFQALLSLSLLAIRRHERIPGYEVVNATKCHITIKDELEVHTDGEPMGKQWDITIECLPKKMKMIM